MLPGKWDGKSFISRNIDGEPAVLMASLYERMKQKGQDRFIGQAFAIIASGEMRKAA